MLARFLALSALLVACAGDPAPATRADYLEALQLICTSTTATIDALPQPPEQVSVADFATSAARAIANEAERARALDVPDDIAADHRAFVLNTDEQATAWRTIATDPADLDASATRIGELVRGRNDLVDEMGAAQVSSRRCVNTASSQVPGVAHTRPTSLWRS